MQNETPMREQIEDALTAAVALGIHAEEALAEAAGLLAEAEATFVRLSGAHVSLPPPPRPRS